MAVYEEKDKSSPPEEKLMRVRIYESDYKRILLLAGTQNLSTPEALHQMLNAQPTAPPKPTPPTDWEAHFKREKDLNLHLSGTFMDIVQSFGAIVLTFAEDIEKLESVLKQPAVPAPQRTTMNDELVARVVNGLCNQHQEMVAYFMGEARKTPDLLVSLVRSEIENNSGKRVRRGSKKNG